MAGPSFLHARPDWTSPSLDGQLYGEPLEVAGRVYVATENDSVYALSAKSGRVLWRTHLATPVPSSTLPCGDITPVVGITGTPVIDPARHELYVVADERRNGSPAHELVGLNVYTGAVELQQHADPQGSDPAALLQRTGLALDGNEVVFGFGGNYGDCSTYHGWVEGVPAAGGTPTFYEVDAAAGDDQGAIWMGGAAPEVDASGNIWVSAGNGSVAQTTRPYDDSDSVLELSAHLALLQYFAPADWRHDNEHDRDLGSSPPPWSTARSSRPASLRRASSSTDPTWVASAGRRPSSPCAAAGTSTAAAPWRGTSSTSAAKRASKPSRSAAPRRRSPGSGRPPRERRTPRSWRGAWSGPWAGATSTVSNPRTDDRCVTLPVGQPQNHFPTPSVGDRLLLVPGSTSLAAFSGSAGRPGPPTPAPSSAYAGFRRSPVCTCATLGP